MLYHLIIMKLLIVSMELRIIVNFTKQQVKKSSDSMYTQCILNVYSMFKDISLDWPTYIHTSALHCIVYCNIQVYISLSNSYTGSRDALKTNVLLYLLPQTKRSEMINF